MLFTHEKKVLKNLLALLFYSFLHAFASRILPLFIQKNKRPFFFLLHFLRYFLKNRIKPPKKFTFCWDNIDKTVQIQVGILTAF